MFLSYVHFSCAYEEIARDNTDNRSNISLKQRSGLLPFPVHEQSNIRNRISNYIYKKNGPIHSQQNLSSIFCGIKIGPMYDLVYSYFHGNCPCFIIFLRCGIVSVPGLGFLIHSRCWGRTLDFWQGGGGTGGGDGFKYVLFGFPALWWFYQQINSTLRTSKLFYNSIRLLYDWNVDDLGRALIKSMPVFIHYIMWFLCIILSMIHTDIIMVVEKKLRLALYHHITVCPRSGDPFYIVSHFIKWVTTSRTHSMYYMIFF